MNQQCIKSPSKRKFHAFFPEMCEAVHYIDTFNVLLKGIADLFCELARPSPVFLYIRHFKYIYRFNKVKFQSQH